MQFFFVMSIFILYPQEDIDKGVLAETKIMIWEIKKNPQQNLHLLYSISARLIKRIVLVFKKKENLHFENQSA